MFCPECKCEYREGFLKCSDCNVDLVKELPVENKEVKGKAEYIEYEFLTSVVNGRDIAMIKSILDSENIIYFIQGESNINCIGGLPAKVMVRKSQVQKAKEILQHIDLSHTII